jgi:hypothetical protein
MKHNNLFIILTIIGLFVPYSCGESHARKEEKANQLVAELDKVETKIILGIENKMPKEKLLDLIGQLEHPSSLYIKGKKYGIIEDKWKDPEDEFFGHFNEYYSQLRTAYKYIVMNDLSIKERLLELANKTTKNNRNKKPSIENKQSQENDFGNQESSILGNSEQVGEVSKKSTDQLKRFVGLYVKQSEDGSIYMYKLSQRESGFEMIYQDNVTGNVVIENFIVTTFVAKTNTINLKSLKDGSLTKVKFKQKENVANSFNLIDEKNVVFEYMPN